MVQDDENCTTCSDNVTLIITTSPVPSMPSTQLVNDLLLSLPASLRGCDIVVTFDGFNKCADETDLMGRAKRGIIPQRQADQYPLYKLNIKVLFKGECHQIDRVGWGDETVSRLKSQSRTITFVEQTRCLGFALSVKACLKYLSTKFVMVLQHDWVFESDAPIASLVNIMTAETDVNYITFMSRRSTSYEETTVQAHRNLRVVNNATKAMRQDKPLPNNLVSFFHILDRPHLMKTELYRDLFNGQSVLTREPFKFRRGDFTEDTVGSTYSHNIKSAPSNEAALEGWRQIGAWMYVADDRERVVRHASGRLVLTRDEEAAKIASMVDNNRIARLEAS